MPLGVTDDLLLAVLAIKAVGVFFLTKATLVATGSLNDKSVFFTGRTTCYVSLGVKLLFWMTGGW